MLGLNKVLNTPEYTPALTLSLLVLKMQMLNCFNWLSELIQIVRPANSYNQQTQKIKKN